MEGPREGEGASSFCFHFPSNCSLFLWKGSFVVGGLSVGLLCCVVSGRCGGRAVHHPFLLLKANYIDNVTSPPSARTRVLGCTCASLCLSVWLYLSVLPSVQTKWKGRMDGWMSSLSWSNERPKIVYSDVKKTWSKVAWLKLRLTQPLTTFIWTPE